MSPSKSLSRRDWLKAATATVAGLLVAARLHATFPAPGVFAPSTSNVSDKVTPTRRDDRRYIHGFEAYSGF